jgi:putative ABC transport system ATP-binding protein
MIRLKDITKNYNVTSSEQVIALDGVTLAIKEGECIVLKGASGSGKSSVLSLIASLSKPSTGSIEVEGKSISKLSDSFASKFRIESIGFVFQRYNLIPSLSVYQNIITPLIPLNLTKKELNERVKRVLKLFHIESKRNILVKNLSGGEQQRVAISRAYINEPKIILADEPTANLDKKLSLEFIDMIQQFKNQGNTIVIATHDPLFFDLKFVDREIELRDGKIV